MTIDTGVLIVGSGPGGYVAAIRAGQLGEDVTLVEADDVGGICLNRGCIPSKALISATGTAHEAMNAEEKGIHGELTVDLSEMINWKDSVVDQLTGGVKQLCRSNGVVVVNGRAEFKDKREAKVYRPDTDLESETIHFEHAIIATGSRPTSLHGFEFDGERVINSAAALSLEEVPDHLIVIGAGYIGMELSSVFAKLGSEVIVLEMLDEILPSYGDDITDIVERRATELGIDLQVEAHANQWDETGDVARVTTEDAGENIAEYEADKILVAVGREPVTDTFGIESLGLQPDEDGFIPTNRQTRTGVDNIFAIGDVAGEPMLAHKASKEGEHAAAAIAGETTAMSYHAIPEVVFTDPEIGTVGMSRSEADASGFNTTIGEFQFRASGRALSTGDMEGFVRLIVDADTGSVLGGEIVGPEASELVAEVGLAIALDATVQEIASTIQAHPTLSEAVMEAAADALGHAIHKQN